MNTPTSEALLWAYLIKTDGTSQILSLQDFPFTCAANEYVWVHLCSDVAEVDNIMRTLQLSATVADKLAAPVTRPGTIIVDHGTLIYLRGINKNPGAAPDDMVSLRVWLSDKMIVTARRTDRGLISINENRQQVEDGYSPASSTHMLIQIIENLADKIHETVEQLDDILVEFELGDHLDRKARIALGDLRRRAASIRRYLAPQRDALDAMFRLPHLSNEQMFELREQTERVTRYIEDLDLARERAMVLQDELRNTIADRQGMRMYVLSMVTAIFLPLSFLTGVFGMNVAGLPGTESPEAFTILVAAMGGLAVAMLIAMLWKRWL
ncbi:zinc transporter ZntB [Alteromonas sp. ASW11-130]|uniref:zinc transporter ZntB n=1 Tax=Alteromonas sp. ASW11-130 TaxID=3015775 RepID=UPI002241DA4F|nr:zinc transporter ZntB [Alteromonas sp. ASW11-130]MCW8091087.1 zinc transporter ZntB [Alteromonas sp. ASW11-130]